MPQLTADNIESSDALDDYLAAHEAVLLLFGGAHCGVCQSIKPRLLQMLAEEFPKMRLCYIDCEQQGDIAAAHRVFTLPVVELYFRAGVCSLCEGVCHGRGKRGDRSPLSIAGLMGLTQGSKAAIGDRRQFTLG